MAIVLLLIFIAVPIIEIGIFIEVGGRLGTWPTVGLVVLTAIAGTWLIRLQGFAVLARAQTSLEQETLPVQEIFDGLCLLLAGALLLTPGFMTDAVGFALLVPAVRRTAGRWIWHAMRARGGFHVHMGGTTRRGTVDETVVEAEFYEVKTSTDEPTDRPDRPDRPSLPRDGSE